MPYDDFSIRMKEYESRETGRRFIPMLPIYTRIDGKNFSSFTRKLKRPYDESMSRAMVETTRYLVKETNARIGYTQSDEISLVWLAESYDSKMPFGGKIQKMVSILAGMASSKFFSLVYADPYLRDNTESKIPVFDCRVFQFPNRTEAANCILWRERDATKNAISMAARSVCSHAELHKKNGAEMQEMMFQRGLNFNTLPTFFKRGTFLQKRIVVQSHPYRDTVRDKYGRLLEIPEFVERTEILELDMPPFSKVANREAVVFDGEDVQMVVDII